MFKVPKQKFLPIFYHFVPRWPCSVLSDAASRLGVHKGPVETVISYFCYRSAQFMLPGLTHCCMLGGNVHFLYVMELSEFKKTCSYSEWKWKDNKRREVLHGAQLTAASRQDVL